jgi:2-phospho-L-lactate guanylyltransferase (CobY/MobA/RfbA family)
MGAAMKATPVVKQKADETPVNEEVLAQSIVSISASMKKLLKSGMNRKAIIVLVQDYTKLSKSEITRVIDALDDLARVYTA